ncbi:MAG: cation:proton antiporter, partial [Alphaproteobacteria bacterium]
MESFLTTLHSSSFYEFSALLVLAAIGGMIGTLLRQPLVIAFIIIGVLAGPSALGIITSDNELNLLAKLGIAILLFIVGLKLDLGLIKKLGGTAALIGSLQMAFTTAIGFALCITLGIDTQTSLLIGISLAFSSTIIIIKMLSDKREIDSLHGQIALGVLIVQDLAVVLAMIILATISAGSSSTGTETTLAASLLRVGVSSIILLSILALFMRFAAQKITRFAAQNRELLICFAIAWAVMLAALCDMLGLSKELGGLLAGITLASTPYRENIISRLGALRDFLLLFFFISLGTQVDITAIQGALAPAIALSIFVLIFKPLIIMTLAGFMGYRKRTGFLAGISLAQISEFSMIFAAMAYTSGFLTQDALGIITLTGIITILTSTYLLTLSEHLYRIAEPALGIFERRKAVRQEKTETRKLKKDVEIILFGLGRYGQSMAESL